MNLIAKTKNSQEFNFISTVFFCLLFTQFFNNGTQLNNGSQLNIGNWQGESDYNSISTNASTLTTKTIALGRITNASALERIGTNLQNSFQEVAINTVASSASQSAINGDSFIDSLKAQGENVLIYTMAKVGANEIGRAYHGTTTLDANGNVIAETPPTIDKSEQLLLHAGLGAITSSLTKNDAMSGAIAGVAGELTAELANENGVDVATSIQLANLAGAISSITYGGLTNQSDDQMAKNAWEGSRIAGNAGANNALQIMAQKVPPSDKSHLTIVHTPEPNEQELYTTKEGYVQDKTSGLWIRTWGAGPSMVIAGDLVSNNNRTRDIDLSIKIYQSPNLVPLNQESNYTNLLNQLDNNYKDNLSYDPFPNLGNSSGYNSNSYASGLLNAAGIDSPQINNLTLPGYRKPIPAENFGVK